VGLGVALTEGARTIARAVNTARGAAGPGIRTRHIAAGPLGSPSEQQALVSGTQRLGATVTLLDRTGGRYQRGVP